VKTNAEIRQEAWGIVRSKWLGRIIAAGGILYFIFVAVSAAIAGYYSDGEIQTWADFLQAKLEALRAGLGYTVPSARIFWQMTGASVFQQFMACVFGSILLFGMAGLLLKAVRNDEQRWFKGVFGGFRRPLDLTWLMVWMNLRIFLWGLLFVIPGIIATYRYRQAWYLKSDHPDWNAGKCLAESGVLMKGRKGQAWRLDFFFAVCWILPAGLALALTGTGLAAACSGSLLLGFLGALGGFASFYFLVFVIAYFFVARTVFYREVSCARTRDLV